ncbi:MAG: ATP-binding cassette domain-containing protein [Planctomycetes bacterium]|nr:ATP-binding cassette domain-containing protein [Planctomycetota bacterium]
MNDPLVLTDVTKRFGDFTAVDRFSLHLPRSQVLGFLGPNGAGKTTTIRMIMSIIYPDEGRVSVLGHPRAIDVKDRIGYLPEERGLYRKMTVRDTLRYFGRLKGLRGRELQRRIDAALTRVGLQEWGNRRAEALSKGMQQKVQFISTILHEPELVILDEPFSGLDPLNVDLLEHLLVELREVGTTVVFSTHQMEQAERLCDRIVLINRGRKVVDGTVAEIRAQFTTRMLDLEGEGNFAALADCPGIIDSHITGSHARLELADGADPHVVVRKAIENLRLSRFEIQRPNLQEIFVKLVGADGQLDDANHPTRPGASPTGDA